MRTLFALFFYFLSINVTHAYCLRTLFGDCTSFGGSCSASSDYGASGFGLTPWDGSNFTAPAFGLAATCVGVIYPVDSSGNLVGTLDALSQRCCQSLATSGSYSVAKSPSDCACFPAKCLTQQSIAAAATKAFYLDQSLNLAWQQLGNTPIVTTYSPLPATSGVAPLGVGAEVLGNSAATASVLTFPGRAPADTTSNASAGVTSAPAPQAAAGNSADYFSRIPVNASLLGAVHQFYQQRFGR